jgi:hypothetical protein
MNEHTHVCSPEGNGYPQILDTYIIKETTCPSAP